MSKRFTNMFNALKLLTNPTLVIVVIIIIFFSIGYGIGTIINNVEKNNGPPTELEYSNFDNDNVTIKLKCWDSSYSNKNFRISILINNNDTYNIQIGHEFNYKNNHTKYYNEYGTQIYEVIMKFDYKDGMGGKLDLYIKIINLNTNNIEFKRVMVHSTMKQNETYNTEIPIYYKFK